MSFFQDVANRDFAIRLFDAGQYPAVLEHCEKLLKTNRKDGVVLMLLGGSARRLGQIRVAADALSKAANLIPDDPRIHIELALMHFSQGAFEKAIARYDRALAIQPGLAPALAGKAGVLEHQGNYAGARELLQPAIDAGAEDETIAVVFARVLSESGRFDQVVSLTRKHLEKSGLAPLNRVHLWSLRAKAHEKLNQIDDAFHAYQQSNLVTPSPFDSPSYAKEIDQIIQAFSARNLAWIPKSTLRSEVPVFIASMPRSGSTLVEQIIHAHPQGFGAGELDNVLAIALNLPAAVDSYKTWPACVDDLTVASATRLSRKYLQDLQEICRQHHRLQCNRIVNKHLENYRYLGLIALLFPGSRIIHVSRDPMDTCFACFTATLLQPWSINLESIAFAYSQYQRLMAHWRSVLPLPILEVQYEQLVQNPEPEIRRIIDFCGLEWDDRCLRFHEVERNVMTLSYDQVRKPMYVTSVKRHQMYEKHLGPLKAALERKSDPS